MVVIEGNSFPALKTLIGNLPVPHIMLTERGVLIATLGSSVLALITRREEVMKPLREKVGAVWMVTLFYLALAGLLETDLDETARNILAGLISVQALLGLTQSFLVLLRVEDVFARVGTRIREWEVNHQVPMEQRWEVRAATRIRTWRLADAYRAARVRHAFWMGDFAEARRRFG